MDFYTFCLLLREFNINRFETGTIPSDSLRITDLNTMVFIFLLLLNLRLYGSTYTKQCICESESENEIDSHITV